MSTTTHRKVAKGSERTAALAALISAAREHEHVGIRPKGKRGPEGRRAAGVKLSTSNFNAGKALDRGIDRAGGCWPDNDQWEIFGADDFTSEWPDGWGDDDCTGDGLFSAPIGYGEFFTEPGDDQNYDNPGSTTP